MSEPTLRAALDALEREAATLGMLRAERQIGMSRGISRAVEVVRAALAQRAPERSELAAALDGRWAAERNHAVFGHDWPVGQCGPCLDFGDRLVRTLAADPEFRAALAAADAAEQGR